MLTSLFINYDAHSSILHRGNSSKGSVVNISCRALTVFGEGKSSLSLSLVWLGGLPCPGGGVENEAELSKVTCFLVVGWGEVGSMVMGEQ